MADISDLGASWNVRGGEGTEAARKRELPATKPGLDTEPNESRFGDPNDKDTAAPAPVPAI